MHAMESGLDGSAAGLKDTAGNTTPLKEVVHVLKFQTTRFRKEKVHHWYLYVFGQLAVVSNGEVVASYPGKAKAGKDDKRSPVDILNGDGRNLNYDD